MKHGINCLPCCFTVNVIDLLQLSGYIDFNVTSSGCRSVKVLNTAVGYSLAAMVTDLC